tara:strand:- start:154 stop:885 length:732 start_codon:yes stop_codon:yes gene_type:complete
MKILVIGDSCTDVYVYGECARLCPDAPVPVLIPKKETTNGGMARNVYQNILSLGASCDLITNSENIIKKRYVDEKTNQMLVRVDSHENNIKRVSFKNGFEKYDAVIISDYCKGFLEEEDIEYICNLHDCVFIDTKKLLGPWCEKAKFIKINDFEFSRTKHLLKGINNLDEKLIVTLGSKGCQYKGEIFPVDKVEVKDMTGAGDTFLAGLAYTFLKTRDIKKSIKFANKCATQVVQQRGVATVK